MALMTIKMPEFKRSAAAPKTSRRRRPHQRERHSNKANAKTIARDALKRLFLNSSDKSRAVNIGFGTAVCDATQISLSFGSTNTREPTQRKTAGKMKAMVLK